MKIAFIGQKGVPATFGGVEYHVDRLSRRLAARGHQVSVYVRPWYTDRRLKNYGGVRLVSVPTLKTKRLDASLHSLLSSLLCLVKGAEIIHYQGIGPSFFSPIPRLFCKKVVSTIHRLDWATEKWGRGAKFFLKAGEWFSVHVAHRTIVVSKDIQKSIRQAHRRQTVLIPNGIETPRPRPLRILQQKYGLSSGQYVLYMGRLVPEKRPDLLIRAFSEMQRTSDSVRHLRLVIAGGSSGTDDYALRLRGSAGRASQVIFTGYVWGEEKEELLSHALLFVLPSYLEGFPIAILEAKSYGLCCLASDIAAHKEVIHHGRDGCLFRSEDAEDLRASLASLIEHPEEIRRLGRNALEDVRKRPSWDEVAERTLAVYEEIVGV